MASRTHLVSAVANTFRSGAVGNQRLLKEGLKKFREAMGNDAKEAAARSTNLPKDWRSRVIN